MIEYEIDSILDFGIYRGKTIQEVVVGADVIEYELISNYIEELYRCFFFGDNEFDIPYSTTQFNKIAKFSHHIKRLRELRQGDGGLELNLRFRENLVLASNTSALGLFDSFINFHVDRLRFQEFRMTTTGKLINSVHGTVLQGKNALMFSDNTLKLFSKLSNVRYVLNLISCKEDFVLSTECIRAIHKCKINWLNEIIFFEESHRMVEFEVGLQKMNVPDKFIMELYGANGDKKKDMDGLRFTRVDEIEEYLWLAQNKAIKRTSLDKR